MFLHMFPLIRPAVWPAIAYIYTIKELIYIDNQQS